MSLTGNGYMAVAGGFPIRLLNAWNSVYGGVIQKLSSTVTAVISAEIGTADVHLALFAMPTTSGGGDNALVTQADAIGVGSIDTTLTLTVPDQTAAAPLCYVLRIWADNFTGSSAETISRDGSTAVASEPRVPSAVVVSSIQVS